MKAITLHQPWASLIAAGAKTCETRSWSPPVALLGERIVIHAAKRKCSYSSPLWCREAADALYNGGQLPRVPGIQLIPHHLFDPLPLGAAVCTAVLDSAFKVERRAKRSGHNMAFGTLLTGGECMHAIDPWGDFSIGRWVWMLTHIKVNDPPVPMKGAQRFWEVP